MSETIKDGECYGNFDPNNEECQKCAIAPRCKSHTDYKNDLAMPKDPFQNLILFFNKDYFVEKTELNGWKAWVFFDSNKEDKIIIKSKDTNIIIKSENCELLLKNGIKSENQARIIKNLVYENK